MTWIVRRGVRVWLTPACSTAPQENPEPVSPPRFRASPNADICGTVSGYQRHNRNRTDVCWDCRDAKREYDRELHARNKAVTS